MGKTSLVRALMSSSFKCEPIDLDDRTVGIDRHEVQLQAVSLEQKRPAAAADPSVASAPPYAAAPAPAAAATLLLFQQQLLSCLSLIG